MVGAFGFRENIYKSKLSQIISRVFEPFCFWIALGVSWRVVEPTLPILSTLFRLPNSLWLNTIHGHYYESDCRSSGEADTFFPREIKILLYFFFVAVLQPWGSIRRLGHKVMS